MPLPDLLQWLAFTQKSGILLLQRGEVIKEIYFRAGKIVASASNDPREFFGQFLLSYGKIEEDDLIRAFEKQGRTGTKLGRLLVMEGLLDESEVQRFLRIKAEESIYDLFLWDEGDFKFYNDAPAQDNHVPIEMDVTSILMEGSRRADEWSRIRKILPAPDCLVGIKTEGLTRVILSDPLYNRMIQLLDQPRRISDLCLMIHASDFAVSKTLHDMYKMGIIEVEIPQDMRKSTKAETGESVKQLCNIGLKQFNNEQYEAAIETFKQVLLLQPGHALARSMIPKAYKEVKDDLVSDEFTIEDVPYLRQSLEDMNELNFTPQENYILNRINGRDPVQAIIRISPIQEIRALMIFKELARNGYIGFFSMEAAEEENPMEEKED